MSKQQSLSSSSEHSDGDVYEVEKIINFKIINGKKQYKVIWTGYSFQEATWEPEENLKCPEKINEFIRRYQDVIKRKNLMKKNLNDISAQSLQKSKVAQSQKSINEKTQSLQKSQVVSRQSFLNKKKLQNSIQKSSLANEKRVPDIDNLKQKIMSSKSPLNNLSSTDKEKKQISLQAAQMRKKNPNDMPILRNISQMTVQNEIKALPSKVPSTQIVSKNPEQVQVNSQVTKVIKIQSLPQTKSDNTPNRFPMKLEQNLQTNFHQNSSPQFEDFRKPFCHNIKSRKNEKNHNEQHAVIQILQESKITSQQSESSESIQEQTQRQPKSQEIFLNFWEKLDIERIICPIDIEIEQNGELQDPQRQEERTHQYFMIKNKFSQRQNIVERERIIKEQPLKLIEFYEDLLIQ